MKKLKEKLSAKLKKQGGFTLVEMLIVVAIIAILVAVSIPLVKSSLDKAKQATDDANLRSAQYLGMVEYLTNESLTASTDYYYHVGANKSGYLSGTAPTAAKDDYGKMTGNSYIKVVVDPTKTKEEEIVVASWINRDAP